MTGGWWGPRLPLSSRTSATRRLLPVGDGLTACGNNASPSPTHFVSLLRSFLTPAVPWRAGLPGLRGGVTEMKPLAQSPAGVSLDGRGQEERGGEGPGGGRAT